MAATVGNLVFEITADMRNVQPQLNALEGNFRASFARIGQLSGGIDVRGLEKTFGTSISRMNAAAIESFASIQAAGADVFAKLEAQQKQRTIISTLTAKGTAPSTVRNEAVEAARFEKIRQDALKASRDAFTEFENSVRAGSGNITTAFGASAAGAKGLTSSMGGLLSVAKSLGLVFGVGFAVGFAKQAVEATSALNDLAEQTGFSGETLLKLKPIANDAGSSIEEFAKGVNQFQKAIIEGAPATVEALHKVGLTANELLKFADDPEGLIGKLSKGLASIADQATAVQVKRDLLSKGGPKLAAAFTEIEKRGGVEGIQAEKPLITNEQIAAVDRLTRSIDNAKISLQALVAVKVVGLFDVFDEIADKLKPTYDLLKSIYDVAQKLANFALSPVRSGTLVDRTEEVAAAKQSVTFRNFPAPTNAPIDLSKATFGTPGDIAKLGVTPAQTDAQRDFKKSLDEQIESLRTQVIGLTQSKEAQIANAAAALKTKAGLIDLTEANDEFNKKLAEFKKISIEIQQATFADQLIKQNQSLKLQITTMTEGKDAADALALTYTIANAKLENMGDAARKAADRQRELNKELAEAVVPQIANTLESETNLAQLKVKPEDVSTNLSALTRDALQKANDALDELIANKLTSANVKTLATDLKLKIEPQLDDRKLDAIIEQVSLDFELAARKADVLNKVFANSFDETAAQIESLKAQLENALKVDRGAQRTPEAHDIVQRIGADLNQAQLTQAFKDVNRDLEIANAQAEIFGRSFDLAGARVQAVEGSVNGLLIKGLKPSTEEAKKLGEQLRNLKVADIFSDLQKNFEDIRADAEILGGAIDLPSESVNALTEALKRLRELGFKPLSPEIQDLKAQLEDAKAAEHFSQAFQDIGRSALGALQDLADGAKIKDVAKRLASNINRAITDALITKPFEEWIKKQTNDLFGGILKLPTIPGVGAAGQSVGLPGAAGQVAGATQIEAVATTSTAGIQANVAIAETTITTLGTTTEAAIVALQAEAIAAIQAAAAGQGASSALGGAANIGSLFSGGTAAAGAAASSEFTAVGAGEIFSTFPALLHEGGLVDAMIRFHDGGIMGGGKIMSQAGADQTGLKPDERMIIAQAGEFVFSKEAVRQIGLSKLEKANEMKQLWPKYHSGGMVHPEIRYAVNIERYHDGGSISLAEGWSNPGGSDMAFTIPTPLSMPQSAMMSGGRSDGQSDGGRSTNIAVFNNPQFQNRQSVGQTSAQLTAAMEAGKRNR